MHRNPGLGDFIQAKVLVSPVVKHEPGLIVQPELEFSPDKIISSFGDFINFGCTNPFPVPVPIYRFSLFAVINVLSLVKSSRKSRPFISSQVFSFFNFH
jgi:hypothetical protein